MVGENNNDCSVTSYDSMKATSCDMNRFRPSSGLINTAPPEDPDSVETDPKEQPQSYMK